MCQKYLTFSISDPPSDDVDGCGLKHVFHRCVWGPDTVMYIALESVGLICNESHGIQSYTGSNTKAKMSADAKLKRKRRARQEERSFVILTGRLSFYFRRPHNSVVCPLSLGEMQQSVLWGEAASSLELHLGGLCGC